MKIAITGGAGFIGSNVVRQALRNKYNVLNIDALTYAGNIANLKNLENKDYHKFTKTNILNFKKVLFILENFKPNYLMHLAASSHVDNSIIGPKEFIKTNIEGTFTLLEAIRELIKKSKLPKNFKFHYISTDEVYGSLDKYGSFEEDDKLNPLNPYSATKASAQHLVKSWGNTYDIPYIISNCSNNYGPYQHPEKLIPKTIINALNKRNIPVYGNGKNIRDWLHVSDHAECLLHIASKGKVSEIYNIGANNEYSNIFIVKKICKILDKKIKPKKSFLNLLKFVKDRPGHDFRYSINPTKINHELLWYPKISFNDGLLSTINWYAENKKWWKKYIKE